ncbi:MAG: DUF4430 domain-containing protein [Clostridia bacterium]|nr:DUF4430 domain-containing protein [Clostridia bacterium]
MKHIKRILTVLLALAIVTAALPMAVFAGAQHQMTVTLRIEGAAQNFYYDTLTIQYSSANLTVQDLIIYADNNSDAITVVGATGSAPYITDINGDVAGAMGGYSGWLYTVNGEEPPVGVNNYNLKEGDSVVFYYGDPYGVGMQYPVPDVSDIANGVIRFTSMDTTYDSDWNPVVSENPVADMTVVFGGETPVTYVTDKDGKITIEEQYLTAGEHSLSIDKKGDKGVPLVLRLAPDYKVSVPEKPKTMTVKLRIEGINENLFYDDVTVSYTSDSLTVQDMIVYADEQNENLTVVGADGASPYITSINGDAAGTFSGWDGWLFTVNGIEAATGINGVNLADGDSVLFYYGDPYGVGMQYPVIDAAEIDSGVIRFTSNDTTYDGDWNPIVTANPVVGMTVTIGEVTFTTDEDGKIAFDNALLPAGKYSISIDKKAENGLPLILRFAPDAEIDIPELPAANILPGDMDDDGEITVNDALRVLRIAAKLVPVTGEALAICDMDGDGEITVSDALYVLRIAAKLIPAPGGQQPGGDEPGTGKPDSGLTGVMHGDTERVIK